MKEQPPAQPMENPPKEKPETKTPNKEKMMDEVGSLLQDVFQAEHDGTDPGRLVRSHGYADGYMRALIEAGICTKQELLDLVKTKREGVRKEPQPKRK